MSKYKVICEKSDSTGLIVKSEERLFLTLKKANVFAEAKRIVGYKVKVENAK